MDDKGRLTITDADGAKKFDGRTFQENGLQERGVSRHDRRAQAAIERIEAKVRRELAITRDIIRV